MPIKTHNLISWFSKQYLKLKFRKTKFFKLKYVIIIKLLLNIYLFTSMQSVICKKKIICYESNLILIKT